MKCYPQYRNDNAWLILMTSKLSRNLFIFIFISNFILKLNKIVFLKYVSQICFFICTRFTGFVWQEESMVFDDRENQHVFKLCYLTAEVVIYIFLSTSKTKKLKHLKKNHKCQMVHVFPLPS